MSVVVIVEPSALEREALEMKLRREGYDTLSTQNGRDAIALLPEAIPDVILLDASTPWQHGAEASARPASGLDTLERMRHDPRWRSIPVVVLGDAADPSDLRRAADLHAADFLLKSGLTWADLLSRVRYYAGPHASPAHAHPRPHGAREHASRFAHDGPDDDDSPRPPTN
ncbi:MAG TPA: response regulator [Tepidisphaeraceae bacterium]|nr:response regulator [Tepidisphaeraceae bacterium]